MVESTDEITMDITLDKVFCINPQLIYMDFIYVNYIINIIIQQDELPFLQTTTPTIAFSTTDSANGALGIKRS